jgi:hypothetical protein
MHPLVSLVFHLPVCKNFQSKHTRNMHNSISPCSQQALQMCVWFPSLHGRMALCMCFSFPGCITFLSTDNCHHLVLWCNTFWEPATFAFVTFLHLWRHASPCVSCLPFTCMRKRSKCATAWHALHPQSLPLPGSVSVNLCYLIF